MDDSTGYDMLKIVVKELEQRNDELSSLLKSSEKSKKDLENMVREQNEEIVSWRANSEIIRSLSDDIEIMNQQKTQLKHYITTLDIELTEADKKSKGYIGIILQMEKLQEEDKRDHHRQISKLEKELKDFENNMKINDTELTKKEERIKELNKKLNGIEKFNNKANVELVNCEKEFKELVQCNENLKVSNAQLNKKVKGLVEEIRRAKSTNNELKLEMEKINAENIKFEKQEVILEDQISQLTKEVKEERENRLPLTKQIQAMESDLKNSSLTIELERLRERHEDERIGIENMVNEMDVQLSESEEKLHESKKRHKQDVEELTTQLEHYKNNCIALDDVEKIKGEMEIKSKLELNTELRRVSALFEQEQTELISSMRLSLSGRNESNQVSVYQSNQSTKSVLSTLHH